MNIDSIINDCPVIKLKIDQINDNSGKYCMSFGFDVNPLVISLKRVGMINKPIVTRNYDHDGDYDVVSGYRRITALKKLGINTVSCIDLTNSGISNLNMLMIAIHDNLLSRKLNFVEKSMVLNRLLDHMTRQEIAAKYLTLLDISKKDFQLLTQIETLSDTIKYSIADGTLSIKALEMLRELSSEDSLILHEWINKLNLSYNYQIQFIEYINDISLLFNEPIKQVLERDEYRTIYNNRKNNIPQTAGELIKRLRETRFPELTRYEKIFKQRVNKLQLPGNIKISWPKYFESEGYRMEIIFKTGSDLINDLELLLKRKGLDTIGNPWE